MRKKQKTKKQHIPNNLRALRKARGLTLEQLADAAGFTLDYVSKLETGSRTLDHELMISFSKPLGCKPEALIVEKSSNVPVKGIIRADVMVELVQEKIAQVPIPVGVEYVPELEAYRFEDDSNAPMAYKDWLFFIGAKTPACTDFGNIPYLIETADGLLMIRKLRKGYTPEHYNLLSPVNNAITEDVAIKWCAKMKCVVPA